ncbi:restriction endonuclease subunit S [Calditrichota bacterium LG25]
MPEKMEKATVTKKEAETRKTVPEGYKMTEVGVIPEDWEVRRVSEFLIKVASGKSKVDSEFGEYPVYGSTGVIGKCIKGEYSGKAVLIARVGANAGKVTPVDGEYGVTDNTIIVKIDKSINLNFFWRQLENKRLNSIVFGSGQPLITGTQIKNLPIIIPPLPEQRAIARALSDVDKLLDSLDKLIAKKKAIKQAAMQQLLTGKVRLPGFSGKWVVKRLEEVSECLDHLRVPLNEKQRANMQGIYPYCGANGILDYINDYVIDDDVILMAEDGGYFDEYKSRPIAYRMKGKIWVNNHAHVLKAKSGYSQGFLFYSLVHKNILPYLASGTRAKLNRSEMNKIEIIFPPSKIEQEQISTILANMDAEIQALERQREKIKKIKQGMMQQLLTGRVRLVKPNKSSVALPSIPVSKKSHSDAFNEAVIISVLAKHFGNERYLLSRKRYTKLSYLLHRYTDNKIEDYLKKAAGPYNPKTKYKGPEKIALEKGYILEQIRGNYSGFIAGDNVEQAERYFQKWYGPECLNWLKQFKYKKTDELELITTVDMAILELRNAGKKVDLEGIKKVISSYPEWKGKLKRSLFSNKNIINTIRMLQNLFKY